jgi:hypothetical protein
VKVVVEEKSAVCIGLMLPFSFVFDAPDFVEVEFFTKRMGIKWEIYVEVS